MLGAVSNYKERSTSEEPFHYNFLFTKMNKQTPLAIVLIQEGLHVTLIVFEELQD